MGRSYAGRARVDVVPQPEKNKTVALDNVTTMNRRSSERQVMNGDVIHQLFTIDKSFRSAFVALHAQPFAPNFTHARRI
jgi:hypothetical protein